MNKSNCYYPLYINSVYRNRDINPPFKISQSWRKNMNGIYKLLKNIYIK